MIQYETIREGVSRCLVKAGTTFRADQIAAYRSAIEKETNRNARWVLERLLENAEIAEKNVFPLCDDTGIPHLYVEIGNDLQLPQGWLAAIHEGVAKGLRTMPGRPMAVKGDDIERVEQSQGLSDDPADVLPVPVITRPVPGNRLGVTVLLLGGGPEIRAKTYRVFHKRSIKTVLDEAASWMLTEVKSLGCTPSILAIGVGRSHTEASMRMIEAMKSGDLRKQSAWERKITDRVNEEKAGALGLGGDFSVLGTFLNIGPLRASGVRIVSVRPCCCVEPRRATVFFEPDNTVTID
ncbi:fumarate hydratase [Geobacter argillaceus]|uniref:Fumarate hydratase subunit alpha n=1 Tax=Geobacter argillaceus TaxID=345631 RepID=A0A562V845_9BACT|nr:fumarate hydratase [Geobacter argillaceus]TWJ14033.1 fumarate hydratase subunit alpha [Geobacter argillaceus]